MLVGLGLQVDLHWGSAPPHYLVGVGPWLQHSSTFIKRKSRRILCVQHKAKCFLIEAELFYASLIVTLNSHCHKKIPRNTTLKK